MKKIMLGVGLAVALVFLVAGRTIDFNNIARTKNGNWSAAQTDTVVWTPLSGTQIVLTGIILSTDGANNVELEIGGTTTDILPPMYFGTKGGLVFLGSAGQPIWVGEADQTIALTSTSATGHSVVLVGYEK